LIGHFCTGNSLGVIDVLTIRNRPEVEALEERYAPGQIFDLVPSKLGPQRTAIVKSTGSIHKRVAPTQTRAGKVLTVKPSLVRIAKLITTPPKQTAPPSSPPNHARMDQFFSSMHPTFGSTAMQPDVIEKVAASVAPPTPPNTVQDTSASNVAPAPAVKVSKPPTLTQPPAESDLQLAAATTTTTTMDALYNDLRKGMEAKDQAKVDQAAQAIINALGSAAGIPQKATSYQAWTNRAAVQPGQIAGGFEAYRVWLNTSAAWWRTQPGPSSAKPLREPAAAIEGCLAAIRAGASNQADLFRLAREAGDYLIKVQKDAGNTVYPFPTSSGWVTSSKSGDLFYDNGLAGSAMFSLFQATGDVKYKDSAIKAANWDMAQPCVTNWNYNSFSVFLLSNAYRVTGNTSYLQSAKEKARLGLYPGQLMSGPNRGRWSDGHNAELVYHYTIIRGLGALVSVLPNNDPELPKAKERLNLALTVRNQEIMQKGIAHPETVLETLSRIQTTVAADRLTDTTRQAVLDMIGHEVAYRVLQWNQRPLAANVWGLYLEAVSKGKA
jgi:hypothetical protein